MALLASIPMSQYRGPVPVDCWLGMVLPGQGFPADSAVAPAVPVLAYRGYYRSPFLLFLARPSASKRLALGLDFLEIFRATLGRHFAALFAEGHGVGILFSHA